MILPITLRFGTLPAGINATPQELIEEVFARTKAEFDASSFLLGQVGGNQPDHNVGPWFKNTKELWVWSQDDMAYKPISNELEIGDIAMTAKADCDSDHWMLCDGRVITRNAPYDKLFTAIGTNYNLPGDTDLTTFRIPNYGSRFPIGVGLGKDAAGRDLSRRSLHEVGGLEMVQLSLPQIPGHVHNLSGHPSATTAPDNAKQLPIMQKAQNTSIDVTAATSITGGDGTTTTDGTPPPSVPHNNMPPWFSILFKIKYQ